MKVNVLEGRTIKSAAINDYGNLELFFTDGSDLEVAADLDNVGYNSELYLILYFTVKEGIKHTYELEG